MENFYSKVKEKINKYINSNLSNNELSVISTKYCNILTSISQTLQDSNDDYIKLVEYTIDKKDELDRLLIDVNNIADINIRDDFKKKITDAKLELDIFVIETHNSMMKKILGNATYDKAKELMSLHNDELKKLMELGSNNIIDLMYSDTNKVVNNFSLIYSNYNNPINSMVQYDETFVKIAMEKNNNDYDFMNEHDDPLYEEIVEFVIYTQKVSASLLQRRFKIGYNRAMKIIDILEERGIIGPQNGSKPREVLVQLSGE